jgi:Rad and Gem related GTP binding protein 1
MLVRRSVCETSSRANLRPRKLSSETLYLMEGFCFRRYGSPHHTRSQSVKTPGSRASGRPNQLCLPQQRSRSETFPTENKLQVQTINHKLPSFNRVASMPNTGVEEEYYRLRHFSITGKGIVNRGDSLKSRRSRSNTSVASSNSR